MKRIRNWLNKICDEYLGESEFEEWWFEMRRFGIGFVVYEKGGIGIELYCEKIGCLSVEFKKEFRISLWI